MAHNHSDYFQRRADDEDRLAESATHPAVKATHRRFAAAYRAEGAKSAAVTENGGAP